MVTDASNDELDRLNAKAQQRRVAAGELGHRRARLPDRPYDLPRRRGDPDRAVPPAGRPTRRKRDSRHGHQRQRPHRVAVMRTDEPQPRDVAFSTGEFREVRLGYAQHVYKAQGLTAADQALVLTGGLAERPRARLRCPEPGARPHRHLRVA